MNYWSGRFLGRYEVILSSFKVLIVLGLMILSLATALCGSPDHKSKGFRYWEAPGAFAIYEDRTALGAAGRAIQQTFYRILAFNLVIITLLGMAIPYDEDILELPVCTSKRSASAFVIAVQMANLTVLPDILNACILVFVVSSASRALRMATRIIRELFFEKKKDVAFPCTLWG
ncbi:hypothetical protein BJX76DRAFT_345312 [Aspergillus varians]